MIVADGEEEEVNYTTGTAPDDTTTTTTTDDDGILSVHANARDGTLEDTTASSGGRHAANTRSSITNQNAGSSGSGNTSVVGTGAHYEGVGVGTLGRACARMSGTAGIDGGNSAMPGVQQANPCMQSRVQYLSHAAPFYGRLLWRTIGPTTL